MNFSEKIKLELAKDLNKALGKKLVKPEDFEYPPKEVGADLALPCFKYAKTLKKSPNEIAQCLHSACTVQALCKYIEHAEVQGNYINFYVNRSLTSKEILKNSQGLALTGKKEKVMLEYVSPNSNKPLHLGHLRNAFLGEAIANILEACGHNIKRTELVNDRGIAISKAMLAYKLFGKGDSPQKSGLKPDHFVGKYYVMFEKRAQKNSKLKEQAQELVQNWEKGDKKTRALWEKMQKWVLQGYDETYKRLNIKFDKIYFESKLYKDGKTQIKQLLKAKKFSLDEKGNIIAKLGKYSLPDKVLLRQDDTAVYATTDLELAKVRIKEGYKNIYYIVGSEQDLYFKQLFAVLKKNGLKANFKHINYGLVELPEGKMKSREGTVVDADDLLDKMEKFAEQEIKKRNKKIKKQELEKRKRAISLAALKFYILNTNPKTKIKFNPKESLSFTGKTGPYILYSYARLNSILKKMPKTTAKPDFSKLNNEEWAILWEIDKFGKAIISAEKELNPAEIANYLYELASKVSDFYHKAQVIKAEPKIRALREEIIKKAMNTLEAGMSLLGIEKLEEM